MTECDPRSTPDRWRSLAREPPERPRQSRALEHGLSLVGCEAPPASLEASPMPRFRDRPHLLRREHGALPQTAPLTPSTHMLFRPEEEHRASREDDVLPPARGRDREVDDRVARREHTVANRESER